MALLICSGLYIRDEDNEADETQSRIVKEVGNVTKESEITFEFGIRRNKPQNTAGPSSGGDGATAGTSSDATSEYRATFDLEGDLPFQVQITYTDLDGAQALRVLTKTKPVTKDRKVAEKSKSLFFADNF